MAGLVVPPGGFAGFNQMTPASRKALNQASSITRNFGRKKKGRKRKAKASGGKRRRRSRKGGKMKFGSPAWQKKYKVGAFRK